MRHGPVLPTTVIRESKLGLRLKTARGVELVIVTETFQRTGSFKFRAAYSVASSVPEQTLVTASSGNFGQALACACQLTGKRCIVVMPTTSAHVKVEAVRGYGAPVDLIDVTQVSRTERVRQLVAECPGSRAVSPFDDELVVRGNATLGEEIAALDPPPEVVIAPVGGGGLVSGITTGIRASGHHDIEVIGAEPAIANDAARSLRAGQLIANTTEPQTMADGARTLSLGELNWQIIRSELREILEVSEEDIAQATRDLLWEAGIKAEPTGALALAALATAPEGRFRGRRVVIVVSGGNVDPGCYLKIIASR